ncbi:DUF4185 domain-containing protein [Rhodococcus triatomae]|uniref:Uncharacterized protein n=1 Tax=Rhodococcus triatomae TaxID=300028 RepID=A0A1G8B6E1_9NOCA|nr:DUF4185 domain-containing protein [Rhodococcus triatomae]QNG21128.1 DUF4185 domain-containing protein [Rhodococcus triatomae]QNG25580.1 DUF4185 domain-containing protein [Rhodococcus triatomae]SDH28200.1 protein of unknown function [Rhodococcus triatomae]
MAVTLAAATGSPAAAQGGPCGQSSGSSGSAALGSSSGSLRDFGLPWLTGPPDGGVPQLVGRTQAIEMVTGPGSPNETIERFNVSGTDLGIMWDAYNGDVLMAFGDTVGDCDVPGDDWRSNVLFRSNDRNLADGMRIDSSPLDGPNHSRQVIHGLFGLPPGSPIEYTVIPTAGVAVGTDQYVRYMSVRSWDTPGNWTTNYSGLARSTDNGETWTTEPSTARVNAAGLDIPGLPAVSAGNENFQQSAFVPGADGWIYEFGTPSGRFGPARLARVQGGQINDLAAYEYWNGSGWVPDISAAAEVIPGTVSELSVQWNDYLNKYVAMYTDPVKGLVIRQADRFEGPWSGTQTLLNGALLPGLYGGFMHPWSSGRNLHFVATTWNRYNVIYMRTDLEGLQMAATDSVDRPDPTTTGESRLLDIEYPGE